MKMIEKEFYEAGGENWNFDMSGVLEIENKDKEKSMVNLTNRKFEIVSKDGISSENLELVDKMEKQYPEMMADFKEMLIEEYLTFARKQNDYGPQNIAVSQELKNDKEKLISLKGIWFRQNDKLARLFNIILVQDKLTTKNEPIEDSYLDLSVYSKIARLVLHNTWAK